MNYPHHVDNIISTLEAAGFSAYIVGGCVRDMMLCISPHDYDITTSALPPDTCRVFSHLRTIKTGLRHGTVTVICDGEPIEITTFRIDGEYKDARHPETVSFTSDIEHDLSRRDFTVNAMAYNKTDGLVDIFGGRRDINNKLIRAVGDPRLRFSEDALRIMRAFRFSAQLDFAIEKNTLLACGELRDGLSSIARERIGSEFIKLITSPAPTDALLNMKRLGVLSFVLGEYSPSDELLSSLDQMPPEDTARLGFLLCETDSDTARGILDSLRCSAKQIKGALAVVNNHAACIDSPETARRLFTTAGIYAPAAARASEILGSSPAGAYGRVMHEQCTPHSLRDLRINGKDIAAMGARGKFIGEVLETLLQEVIADPSLNTKEILLPMAQSIISKGNT